MEEKKLDLNSIIGFILVGGILIWMMYINQPTKEEIAQDKLKKEQVAQQKTKEQTTTALTSALPSTTVAQNTNNGIFLPATPGVTEFENDVLYLKIDNKGGQIIEAKMKNFVTYDSIPVYMIKDHNAALNLTLKTANNTVLQTKDLVFTPKLTQNGDTKVLTMRLRTSENAFLEYRYALSAKEYMLDFSVRTQGLSSVLNTSEPAVLDWRLRGIRHSKSVTYENRYTEVIYEYDGGKDDYLNQREDSEDEIDALSYVAFKQYSFSSILLTDKPFKNASVRSKNLVEDDSKTVKATKDFGAKLPLAFSSGELQYPMNFYFGPTDYKILNAYDRNLDEVVSLGWGIFGWINKYIFIPLFGFLSSMLPTGIAIVVLTVLVRLAMSPVTYKSYVSQAKMKVLRPEINEINEKFKDEPMKKQQETMKLYSKAGVSPASGCVPALIQMPVFYALFAFFPAAFILRQKRFLWAEDLSSYDTIAELPFSIPFYGDHVSLFPILASIAIFIYMQMTAGQNMQQPQPGMPNMKFILYLSPIMMLFFFNNYASGLSLYYFVSNLITIFIMLVIKHYIIDEDKIHAKIQENKKKPKKKSRFQAKMQEMMEQAEAQRNAANKK